MRLNIREATPKKPSFKIQLKEPASLTPFQRLVREAMDVWRRLDDMRKPQGPSMLSAEAFLRETLKITPTATAARVRALRRKLEERGHDFENTQSALRVIVKEIAGPNVRTPPKAANWGRIERVLLRPRVTEVQRELTAAGFSSVELFGVGVLMVADRHPEKFGTAKSSQSEIDEEVESLSKRLGELLVRIERGWTADDIDTGRYAQGRTSPTTFKGTPVEVAPADGSGKRLIEYMLKHRP